MPLKNYLPLVLLAILGPTALAIASAFGALEFDWQTVSFSLMPTALYSLWLRAKLDMSKETV